MLKLNMKEAQSQNRIHLLVFPPAFTETAKCTKDQRLNHFMGVKMNFRICQPLGVSNKLILITLKELNLLVSEL